MSPWVVREYDFGRLVFQRDGREMEPYDSGISAFRLILIFPYLECLDT
jgi:hypothetical protein